MITFQPGPVGQMFFDSRKFVKLICGPVGGGKSTDALMELFMRSINQQAFQGTRRTKFIVMRNTMQQLMSTVKPLIDYWFVTLPMEIYGQAFGQWRLTEKVFEMKFKLGDGTIVHSEYCLMPADTPDDVRRLLSLECSAAWIEEAREIDQAIFEGLQGRTDRFPSRKSGGVTYPGVIMSTNPPPMGSWLQELMATPPANMEVFMQPPALLENGELNVGQQEGTPPAENLANLSPDYYPNLMEGKTEDWLDVFMRNKFGAGGFGMPVFKNTFKLDFHKAKEPLALVSVSNYPLVVGMDNGLTAAAVIGQMDARSRVNILGECFVPDEQTMGVETFLDRLLVPFLRSRFPVPAQKIIFVLDPACWQRSQVNEITIAQAVNSRGFQTVKAPTQDPERRVAAVEGLLTRAIDGGPGMLISPECPHLLKALDWGYRNKKTQTGVTQAVPEKNHFSHISDALQYLACHFNPHVNPAGGMYRKAAPVYRSVAYPFV